MIKLLKHLDFFGTTFSFMINREKKYQTSFGGVTSLIIISIIVTCFSYFLNEFLRRQRFTFYTQETLDDSAPTINGGEQNFSLYFEMDNQQGEQYSDERVFSIKLYQVHDIFNNSTFTTSSVYESIPLSFCKRQNNKNSQDNTFCIDNKWDSSIVLNGTYNADIMSYLELQVNICVDKTSTGDDCLNKNQIRDKLNSNKFSFFYTAYFIDLKEFENPKKSFLTRDNYEINFDYTRSVSYYFKNLFFYSDDDWLFENSKLTKAIILHNVRESINFLDETSAVFKMRIYPSNIVTKYFRQYRKFLQIFVDMGGLINSLIVVGSCMTHYINDIRMKLFIMNRLYDFLEDEKELKIYKRRSNLKGRDVKLILKTYPENNLGDDFMLNNINNAKNANNLNDINQPPKKGISFEDRSGYSSSVRSSNNNSNSRDNNNYNYNNPQYTNPPNFTQVNTDKGEIPSTYRNLQAESTVLNNERKKNYADNADFIINKSNSYSNTPPHLQFVEALDKKRNLTSVANFTNNGIFTQNCLFTTTANLVNNDNDNNDNKNVIKENNIQIHSSDANKSLSCISEVNKRNSRLKDDSNIKIVSLNRLLANEDKRNKKFTLSYPHLFCMTLCCCIQNKNQFKQHNKIQMYEKAEQEISKTFDVVEIYKELHTMSGFISFFLNPEQMLLLKHIERPKIIFKNLQPESKKKQIENLIQCFNSYVELKGNLEDSTNRRLIEKLDLNVREVFNEMLTGAESPQKSQMSP